VALLPIAVRNVPGLLRAAGNLGIDPGVPSDMKRVLAFCALLSAFAVSVRAEAPASLHTGSAPPSDSLFSPLRGDPRELHFALRVAFPFRDVTTAEVAIGHYYGIYRWALPGEGRSLQLNIGGGIFPRFNFSNKRDLQIIDFYGNIPLDARAGRWSGRVMLYHVSSHLGDDYIRTTGRTASKNSWNSVRSLVSYDAGRDLRLYGGHTYHIFAHPPAQKRQAFQSGFEVSSRVFHGGRAQGYWANDLQWWERTRWKPMFNSQLGVRTGREPRKGRGVSYFVEFRTGPEYDGQFFRREETRFGLGVRFNIV
jgi:hypothetical protein